MHLTTKIAYNTIIQIISKIIATILGLLTVAIITRYLGDEGYGQYTTIITFLSFFGIIADMGLTLITVQMISRPDIQEEKILSNLITLRFITALVFLVLAPVIALLFPYNQLIKTGIAITAASFLFTALNQILIGLFQKDLRMDKVSIAEVASRTLLLAGSFLSLKNGWGLNGILWSTVASSLANFAWLYLSTRSKVKLRLRFDKDIWLKTFRLSWPLAITISLNLIYLKSDTLLLSVIPRESEIGIIAEVGLYGAAYKVIDVLVTIPFMFSGLILPFLTKAWAEKNKEKFNNITRRSFELLFMFVVPMVIGTQIISDKLMRLIAGPEFIQSGPILKLLIWACFFIFIGNIFAHGIIALNRQKNIIKAYIFTAISSLALYLFLIPKFSYYGAAWITIYSEAVIAVASIMLIRRETGYKFEFIPIIKFSAAGILMGLIVKYFNAYYDISIALDLLIGIIAYPLLLLLMKAISPGDILILLNKKTKNDE